MQNTLGAAPSAGIQGLAAQEVGVQPQTLLIIALGAGAIAGWRYGGRENWPANKKLVGALVGGAVGYGLFLWHTRKQGS